MIRWLHVYILTLFTLVGGFVEPLLQTLPVSNCSNTMKNNFENSQMEKYLMAKLELRWIDSYGKYSNVSQSDWNFFVRCREVLIYLIGGGEPPPPPLKYLCTTLPWCTKGALNAAPMMPRVCTLRAVRCESCRDARAWSGVRLNLCTFCVPTKKSTIHLISRGMLNILFNIFSRQFSQRSQLSESLPSLGTPIEGSSETLLEHHNSMVPKGLRGLSQCVREALAYSL